MSDNAFPDMPRVDAREKVLGQARYGADDARPEMVHAALAVATIARGKIKSIDIEAAKSIPKVRLILTHADLTNVKSAGFLMGGGYGFQSFQPLITDTIAYRGQPIALVAADSLEAAIEAAALIRAAYTEEAFNVSLDAAPGDIIAQADSPLPKPAFGDLVAGDADGAYEASALKVDAVYTSPPQHQNPIELIATVAEWNDGVLTIHEGTQNAEALRHGLARQLDITADRVQVISPYVGGGFGQKNSTQMQTVLAAVVAQRMERPVKLVVPRTQLFHDTSFRPASKHRMRLGAEKNGRLIAAIHEIDSQTSRHDLFPGQHAELSARLHGIENFRGRERLVRTDYQTPGYMRAPYEHLASLAMECTVDELAYQLNMDPVALRLMNDTKFDPISKKPLSSRHVVECLSQGAELFGWSKRTMQPGSMRTEDGTMIGWGVAIGGYKTATAPAIARMNITAEGEVYVSVAGHEMGQGIRTAIANMVARRLKVEEHQINISVGDTRFTPQHLTAGSWGTATAIPAVSEAAEAILKRLVEIDPDWEKKASPFEALRAGNVPEIEVEIRRKAPGQPDQVFGRLTTGLPAAAGPIYPDFVTFSYIAHFVEVRVEPNTRRIRVPRVVSIADCGRVVSPRTAASQVRGGVVWGIGATLREASEIDPRFGGFLNADLAEYPLPVNADIGSIDVGFVDKPDPLVNSVGVKGLGEVAMVGVAPAIVNAVFHATGKRLRDLPIRIEHVL